MPATGATISDLALSSRSGERTRPGAERRCPGRPPVLEGGERRELIIQAACEVLRNNGYHGASMDKLAHLSGMSKKTIYQMFASKLDLFQTLIRERLFDMKYRAWCPCPNVGPEEELVQILLSIAGSILQPDRMSLTRAIVGEIRDAGEIRKIMEGIEISGNSNQVEAWLHRQRDAGTYAIDDVEDLGRGLFNMTVGKMVLAELFYCNKPLTRLELEANIRRWVRIFLRGLPPPPRCRHSPAA
ncbi:TetR/AcrR family transcriptional regulator [Nguyenibacter vanlangensis]|uniref:TetR/AcrR family transcriptional regulator n=1 Tax=Nguyenibacter vanlangensis TaxID=1216886 RepID=A0A7Y7J047_9PROT|nr:TetR/AcrR family transcriptional regulator [Nguyenibacter vanlangensis]NVN13096.1 TetR/AcrR family transcriptional regulator [Nguyenibacter vanlangensis]